MKYSPLKKPASKVLQKANGRQAGQETSDYYGEVLAVLDQKHRVIICRDGIQWITQRRKSGGAARPWRALGYHTTQTSLIRACATLCGEIDPNAMSVLLALPDVIGRSA